MIKKNFGYLAGLPVCFGEVIQTIGFYLKNKIYLGTAASVLFFLFSCFEVSAQSGDYRFYNISKIQSNEVIKGISKDERGFVWLATDQGVLNFDGRETNLFLKELPSPYTKKFLQRKNGQFLVLTDSGLREIIHTRDTTWFRPLEQEGNPFTTPLNFPKSIFEDREGNLWIGEVNAVVKISASGFKRYFLGDDYQSINYHRAFSFAEDAFGHIWVAPYKGRLLSYNPSEDRLADVEIPYPLSEVTCMLSRKGDHLLIGGKEGMLSLKTDSDRNILEQEFIPGPENISAAIEVHQDILVGTWDNGLYKIKFTEEAPKIQPISDLPFTDILDFDYDEQQNEIWIAGSENIGLLKPVLFSTIGQAGKYRVESFSFDSTGTLYISTGSQLLRLDQEGRLQTELSSKLTYFNRILGDGNLLWIGDAFGNISKYNLYDKSYENIGNGGPGAVQYIFQDHRNNKWFTGLPLGLIKINAAGELHRYSSIGNSVVVKESADQELFCGGGGSDSLLYLFNPAQDRFDLLKLTLNFKPSADIKTEDIAFDSLGNIWIATTEGLIKIRKDNRSYRGERVVLKGIDANEPVKAIAIEGNRMWLAYSQALVVYQGGEVVFYTPENGLPSRLLKERCFEEKDGKLFIATAKGLAMVKTGGQVARPAPVPVIKGVWLNGQNFSYSKEESLSFPYGSRVQVDFVSLSYPGNNILYQTKLAGLENTWSEPSANSSMSVLGFSEGIYTLQVRARDNGLYWSEPLSLSFSVARPWFRTWWAMVLFGLSVLLLISGSVKVYHFHLIRQKRRLQRIVEARTKEINFQKNEIIEQKNKIIEQKEQLIEKNNAVYKSQQALSEADLNYLHLKEKQLQDQIEYRNKQITTHTLNIIQKNEMLKELRDQLEVIIKSSAGAPHQDLKRLLKIIDESFRLDKDWEEFKLYFEQIYTGFYAKLKISFPELSNQELRHCALIRLNLSNNECASILGISQGSIKVSRTRLRKKLKLENHQSLTDFVMGI